MNRGVSVAAHNREDVERARLEGAEQTPQARRAQRLERRLGKLPRWDNMQLRDAEVDNAGRITVFCARDRTVRTG
jgi:hypothetical protein